MTAGFFLSPSARQAMDRLGADLVRVFGDRFVALVAYGADRTAAFAASIDANDLEALAPLVDRWHREGLQIPLVLTPDEFRRSLDAFPLEYQAMLDGHVVIAGRPPFDDARPSSADLRRACETQAKAFVIHLRQGWLNSSDDHGERDRMLAESAAPLRALLSSVARLHDAPAATDDELAAFAETRIGASGTLVRQVLALRDHPERAHTMAHDMSAYLACAERLWAFVDGWRA